MIFIYAKNVFDVTSTLSLFVVVNIKKKTTFFVFLKHCLEIVMMCVWCGLKWNHSLLGPAYWRKWSLYLKQIK